MFAMIRTCISAMLITGVLGRSLLHHIASSTNSSDDNVSGELPTDYECDLRYYKHYEIKGCVMNQVDSRGCPISYYCPPPANASFSEQKVCIYQNAEYKVGDKIELNDKCKVCRCMGGTTSHIACRQRECPQLGPAEGHNCHLVYEKDKCCPLRYQCISDSAGNDIEATGITCTYNGKEYPLGAKIYPPDDVCLVCECSKNWNGVDNSSCYQQECVLEKNKLHLDAGCIPVYHETKCCPIEYYCPESAEVGYSLLGTNEDSSKNSSQCYFAGSFYDIGIEIPMNNPCIKCSCQVPPDFTCVHQSCPLPPDTENCDSSYTDHQCCPIYECLLGDEKSESKYINKSSEAICPTPMCADKSCVIGILPGHECPTCICDDGREKNDFEPINIIEIYNETQALDNEILSPLMPKNFSEREPLSQVFEGELLEKGDIDHEKMEGPDFRTQELEPALPKQEEPAYNETESSTEWDTMRISAEGVVNATTGASNELRLKRSENLETAAMQSNHQQQWTVLQQDQLNEDPQDSYENVERELEGSNEDVDEMQILSTKNSINSQRTLLELIELDDQDFENVIWSSEVPGCPTPMCADSSCRIGIPQGRSCPTCVCKKRRNRQP